METKNPTRRDVLKFSGLGMVAMYLEADRVLMPRPLATPTEYYLYVGSYTSEGGAGITLCRLKMATGALEKVSVTGGVEQPSFLAVDSRGRYLYAVNELATYQGKAGGAVSAFAINPTTRALTLINQQASQGAAPCFVSVTAQNQYVMVANYTGGNVTVFPVRTDGGLGTSTDMKQFSGSGPSPNQDAAHAHQLMTNGSNQYAIATDLGSDKVRLFQFNATQGTLKATAQAYFSTKPGAGPRHFAFHPNGKIVYVICELNSTLTSLTFDDTNGTLTEVKTVSTLPAGYTGANACAEVHVSPDGQFVYGSNRGHNSIVVFSTSSLGALSLVQHISTQGDWPRDFILDPTGTYLLVANERGNTIVSFSRNATTGKLTALGSPLAVNAPTSLVVAPTPS